MVDKFPKRVYNVNGIYVVYSVCGYGNVSCVYAVTEKLFLQPACIMLGGNFCGKKR